jgi:ABC-2 type transport system permease protein
MTLAVESGLFSRRKILESLRQPAWIIMGLTTPLLYLALFTPLLNSLAGGPGFPPGHVLDVFVPGILVLIAFGAGMGLAGRSSGNWTRASSSGCGALVLKQIGSLAAVVTGTQLPLTLLSGTLLPLSLRPAWLRVLGHLNPMYYAWGTRAYQKAMA